MQETRIFGDVRHDNFLAALDDEPRNAFPNLIACHVLRFLAYTMSQPDIYRLSIRIKQSNRSPPELKVSIE